MKWGLILGIGVLTLAGMTISAGAADLPRAPVAAPPVPLPFNWSGCYLGLNVGGKWGSIDGSARHDTVGLFPATVFPFNSDSETGIIYGGQVGCAWQTGSFVWGIEGDFNGTDISRDFVVVPPGGRPLGLFLPGDRFSLSNDWQASIRGRLGWAFDRFQIYATGGVAWANFTLDAELVGIPIISSSKTLTGWTVGGGFEYAFTPNWGLLHGWSLGAEYRYSQFDGADNDLGNRLVALGTVVPIRANADLQTHEVTARINYRFNLFGSL